MTKEKKLKIVVGKGAYMDKHDDYAERTGTIVYCGDCCKENRVQFDVIGNNERLSHFNLAKCHLYYE